MHYTVAHSLSEHPWTPTSTHRLAVLVCLNGPRLRSSLVPVVRGLLLDEQLEPALLVPFESHVRLEGDQHGRHHEDRLADAEGLELRLGDEPDDAWLVAESFGTTWQ